MIHADSPRQFRNWPLDHIGFGGDYNPEQWPREVWREDVELMLEASVNLVTLGVFSWGLLEPEEGRFDFSWMDEVVDLLTSAGIRFTMATPTAAPPQWFFEKYPQARVITRDGVPLGPWSRGAASPSSPEYRDAIARVARAIGEHYGQHPDLVMWHVHNEYGAPVSECFGPWSVANFRSWVERRYGSIDEVNTVWGTAFWGQTITSWQQVTPPGPTPSVPNPALRLDWARFTNDALAECFVIERDILHELAPDVPVTTNFMAHTCPSMDLWQWSRLVDVVSNDHYLTAERLDNQVELALDADLTRSLAGGRPWVLMEHSTSAVNWQPRNIAKRPGEMARNSLSHLARGADAVLFFQWRASLRGAEKFHSAMLPHGGTDSRVWREVRALGATLRELAPVVGSAVSNDVAIVWDWQSNWAQGLEWRPSIDLSVRREVDAWYRVLWDAGVGVDFAAPGHDLSRYRLVLAPALYLLSDADAANLTRYVASGGCLAFGPFSGVVDEMDSVRPGGLNEALAPLSGTRLMEFAPLREAETVEIAAVDATAGPLRAHYWTELHQPSGAEVMATFMDGPLPGEPALLRHVYGEGQTWQLAASLTEDSLSHVLRSLLRGAGISVGDGHPGLEIIRRRGAEADFEFRIDHAGAGVTWSRIAGPGRTPLPGGAPAPESAGAGGFVPRGIAGRRP